MAGKTLGPHIRHIDGPAGLGSPLQAVVRLQNAEILGRKTYHIHHPNRSKKRIMGCHVWCPPTTRALTAGTRSLSIPARPSAAREDSRGYTPGPRAWASVIRNKLRGFTMHSVPLIRALPWVLLLLLLGGCSSGSSSSPGTSDTEDPTDPSPDPSPEPGDDGTGPGPAPGPDPGADDGVSAAACFPTPLLTTGNVLTDEQRTTTPQGVFDTESTVTVAGPATFDGQSVVRVFGSREDEASGVVASFEFFFSQGDGAVVLTHGQRSEASSGPGQPASTTEQTYSPPLLERYDLSPGQGFEQSYELISQTTVSGTAFDSIQSVQLSTTYVRRESVTVPAGTFSTCRYEQTQTVTPPPIVIGDQIFTPPPQVSEITTWYAVDSGFPVRRVNVGDSGTETSELLSFSINGVPVTGN